ncbi:hypothetical protein [Leptospira kmetyi]|uniref:hypothetical protein n=1 Tax=Leptospira kmetyi TaxID=408139 RepID=UPI000288DB00|nr:hypothetical protein [Leptospira kmetyi]
MKDRNWINCPSCGIEVSTVFSSDLAENYSVKGYDSIKVLGLDGYFCRVCKDGIFTRESQNHINSVIAKFKAKTEVVDTDAPEHTE